VFVVWTRGTLGVPFRFGITSLSFLLLVVFPTLITLTYLGLIASKEYVSEARLVVRTASDDSMRKLANDMLSIATMLSGSKSSQQDTHIVIGYLRGRSVIDDLGGKAAVERIYSRPGPDWYSRLAPNSPFENVWRYWGRKVDAVLDTPSGIVTLEVRAFSPQDAYSLATRLVELSERLVNEISRRARADTLRDAEAELQQAKQRVDERRNALLAFRNKQEILDPIMTASSIANTVAELTREKFRIENQIAATQGSIASDAPTMRTLRGQLATIDDQIHKLEAQLAGDSPGRKVLASQLAAYEHLQLELKFAEKLYEISESASKRAQFEAQKQQLYLVSIVRPTMPEDALYPRPVLDSLLVFVWLTVAWGVAIVTIAGVRDHR
jgi:capsular polysaccharide transport system permease protein